MPAETTTTPIHPGIRAHESRAASSFSNEHMQIADFRLERYFARWEFAVRHVLCASDSEPWPMQELLALADDDARVRWDSLRLGYTESLGLPALRDEIASLYPGLVADDVMTFTGAEEAVFLTMH